MKRRYISPNFEYQYIRSLKDVLADSQPEPHETIHYNDPVIDDDLDPFS